MKSERRSGHDAEKLARQEEIRDIIKQRAEDGWETGRQAFEVGFGEILEIADVFDLDLSLERRAQLEEYSKSHITFRAGSYKRLTVKRLTKEAQIWADSAIAVIRHTKQQN